jgi:hypothetical protein
MSLILYSVSKNLKVITKLANVVLTPENPKYLGRTWNVEGTKSEDMMVSFIITIVKNITKSTFFLSGSELPNLRTMHKEMI